MNKTIDEKIELMIAQSAPFSPIRLWENADFERLKNEIKSLVKSERKSERKAAVEGFVEWFVSKRLEKQQEQSIREQSFISFDNRDLAVLEQAVEEYLNKETK